MPDFSSNNTELLSELPIGIVIVNRLRRISYYNPRAGIYFNNVEQNAELICHNLLQNSDIPCLECPLEAGGLNPFIREIEIPDKGYIVEIQGSLSKNGDVIETVTDVTHRRLLQNQLDQAAMTDPGSGLMKRHFVRDHLQREIQRARRFGGNVSLIMLRASSINNGGLESVPKTIAQVIRGIGEVFGKETRAYDLVYRFGPDTFAIILPNEDLAGAINAASRLHLKIKALGIEKAKSGVASMNQGTMAESLIYAAQQALYRADHSEESIATT